MAGKVKYQTKSQRKQQDVPAYTTDVTKDVIAAVRAGGNPTFANWRATLRQQGWDNPELIKYDPTSGKFISSDPKLSPQAHIDAAVGDAVADSAAGAAGVNTAAEAAASRVESMPDEGIPGSSFITSDNTGDAHVPDVGGNELPSELAVGVAPLAKSSSSGVSSDVAKGFLLALRVLGFGSGAGNPDTPKPVPEPGMSDFIGNGNGFLWDSTAPATGYRPEPKTSDYSVGPSRALRDEIHNAAIRADQDTSGQNWRASK